ncbi:hypothetical protein [Cyclobacterium plantarum]|uniref:hypothetical protein n=1 Tax=Cyclobacterium plantarum TaxID=2716263 RepID=UPI003F72F7FF
MKISFFFLLVVGFGCVEKAYFDCDKCSDLKGLSFEKVESKNDLYRFNLAYPVGVGSDEYFRPHFKIDMHLRIKGRKVYKEISDSENFKLLWNLSCKDCIHSNEIDGYLLSTSIDTVFTYRKSEEIYALRVKNFWKENFDNSMGSDFVLFVSESGVKGMYISQTGDELFDESVDEIVYYPIGEIFYLRSKPTVEIIE